MKYWTDSLPSPTLEREIGLDLLMGRTVRVYLPGPKSAPVAYTVHAEVVRTHGQVRTVDERSTRYLLVAGTDTETNVEGEIVADFAWRNDKCSKFAGLRRGAQCHCSGVSWHSIVMFSGRDVLVQYLHDFFCSGLVEAPFDETLKLFQSRPQIFDRHREIYRPAVCGNG